MEHIEPKKQQSSLDEIFRIMKSDGLGFLLFHHGLIHMRSWIKAISYFPFKLAKFLRNLFFNKKVKYNSLEELPI